MPLWIILFPEGTWIKPGEGAIQDKANEYARQNGFPELRNVLFPRSAGFVALLEEVRQPEHCLDAVYDVTVAYNRPYHPTRIGTEKPPNVVKLASGGQSAPKEVHFNVRRHVLPGGIPAGEEGAAKWLQNAYAVEKEGLLEEFHTSEPHCFPGPDRSKRPLAVTHGGCSDWSCVACWCAPANLPCCEEMAPSYTRVWLLCRLPRGLLGHVLRHPA